jgi:tetratricopeptide (TPR) repeat protein
MSKSRHIRIWGVFALLALVVAVWVYFENNEQKEKLIRADQRIESGIALFKEKKYPEALEVFENIPPGSSREWYARYYQGSAYIMLKDYQPAITYLEQALVLNPTETQIMHALGVAYFKLGKIKISKAYFASVLEIHPEDAEARGLMDIMANLERQQPGAAGGATSKDDQAGTEKEDTPENDQSGAKDH